MADSFQLGIDIVSVSRMRQAIERQGSRFLDRIFTKAEQAYCNRKRNKFENYAARFAAKEAVIKAKKGGPGRYAFRDIEVIRNLAGAPSIQISSQARKKLRISPNAKFELTITHEREFAVAAVALFG
ncbi:MAG: holo-[acyl-carrier-protein] synthase [Omnitrophica bacterium RIFCSPHIGHO2_02_FULL_46_11]|nr:MAG: holo-[acyl-carrier-protein] synthase [Omnitrophica bacterium RIFCSPLOWO2_01_FULL_45_10b]OGW87698.1 MAG: holo-[acyl-carrier-protein] synthase [Omnitrophica bacterium RIFCSPHIGHO2_02_FULL_46_11]